MNNKKYIIGEFAAINQISTRMLRHYDKIGLIKPNEINNNGYRYYSEDQIEEISKIKMLKACQFSLKEIKSILLSDDNEILKEYSINKIRELSEISEDYSNTILTLRSISYGEEKAYICNNIYEISLTDKNSYKVLILNKMINQEQIENEFLNIYNFAERNNIFVNRSAIMINYTSEMDDKYYKVALPVNKDVFKDSYSTLNITGGRYISTIHYGSYENLGCGYNALIKYAKENNYEISSTFLEKYFVDSKHTNTENQYITEISTLILNTP